MNLCVDIGNTRIKVAVFDDRDMVYFDVIDAELSKEIALIWDQHEIDKIITSSTRKELTEFENMISSTHEVIRLSHTTPIPFENTYKTKATLGKDRIAVIAAAVQLYPRENNLVIDLGTCITYDFVDENGIYHGGNIAPGMEMRLQAMNEFTSSLPRPKAVFHENPLGKTTDEALRNGAIYGIKYEIEGLLSHLSSAYTDINVILTGGNAEFFVDVIYSKIFVHPYLVLEGLNEILLYNAQ